MPVKVVQIIFEDQGKVALGFRQNVHAFNNLWAFPCGRVEINETPREAAIRESIEEVGVRPIKLVELFVLNDELDNEHHFFRTDSWKGDLVNAEPELCREICWFEMKHLPANCTKITYLARAEYNHRM